MRYLFLFIVICFLSSIQPLSAQKLKVMSYNIYHAEKAFDKGNSSLVPIAELIRKHKPDFVALQEVDSMTSRSGLVQKAHTADLIAELSRLTGMYGYFGKAIDYEGGGYGLGILTRSPASPKIIRLPLPEGGEKRIVFYLKHTVSEWERTGICFSAFISPV